MHDVISAFLDNEPIDGHELSAALATPEGRDLLLDLIAMRVVINPIEVAAPVAVLAPRRVPWMWASAAAVLIALVGGYQFGRNAVGSATPVAGAAAAVVAPEPTAVITFEPGVNWTEAGRSGGN